MSDTPTPATANSLLDTTDAQEWAREFCRHAPAVDEGWMIGWFANAIETGRRHHPAQVAADRAAVDSAIAAASEPQPIDADGNLVPTPPQPHDHKGHSEERCIRCGWIMGHPALNCMNDDTPHVFPSQHPVPSPSPYEWSGPGALQLIAAERARQTSEKGWTIQHDLGHPGGVLTHAAIAYGHAAYLAMHGAEMAGPPFMWPWTPEDWKPTSNPVRMLVKAAALIVAEIDRCVAAAQSEAVSLTQQKLYGESSSGE